MRRSHVAERTRRTLPRCAIACGLGALVLSACAEPEEAQALTDAGSASSAVPSTPDTRLDGGSSSSDTEPDAAGANPAGGNGTTRSDAGHLDGAAVDAASPRDAARVGDADTRGDASGPGDASVIGGGAPIAKPSEFHCVNWADARDNFVNGLLQLSGLDSKADSYESVRAKTVQIVGEFRAQLGANTIRIPINEPTVASPWWDAYKAVIDGTAAEGMNVIVSYWAYHNQKLDDEAAFKAMWQKVVAAYAANDRVFFDIHNEPAGFGASWNDEAARWLGYFPTLPRARVIVAGTGSDDNVVPVGRDARFDGCILELHDYAFWHTDWNTKKQWTDGLKQSLGAYTSRTFIGEWGAPMTTGLNYNTPTPDGDNAISFITATADLLRANHMGSCYWPGLRDGDSYTLMKRNAGALPITLSVVNSSGRDRLRWAWNL
jgi:endoglucanase